MKKVLVAWIGCCMWLPASLMAADDEGNYALSGAGSLECARYVQAAESSGSELRQYMSWMQGYLTATNRLTDATFEIVPFVGPQPVASLMLNICRNAPEERFENALAGLIRLLQPLALEESSPMVQLASGDDSTVLRETTLRRVRDALAEKGFYEAPASGDDALFNQAMQDALRDFQREQNIAVTGVPDTDTIVRLFFDEP